MCPTGEESTPEGLAADLIRRAAAAADKEKERDTSSFRPAASLCTFTRSPRLVHAGCKKPSVTSNFLASMRGD